MLSPAWLTGSDSLHKLSSNCCNSSSGEATYAAFKDPHSIE